MSLRHDVTAEGHVIVLTGDVGLGQVRQLRSALSQGLGADGQDVLLDARAVTTFEDAALTALSTARSWAKQHQHRILVIDTPDGCLASSLRGTGLWERFPLFSDSAAAWAALSRTRATRRAMDTAYEARWRDSSPSPTRQR